jgi:uncharacterized protein (DUF1697 family)
MNARAAGHAGKVVLLRGTNLGCSNRIAMPALRNWTTVLTLLEMANADGA